MDASALLWFIAGCTVSAAVAAILAYRSSRKRTRDIQLLTSQVERVLDGSRALDFDHMSEGPLAVLASDLDKMVNRLNSVNDQLGQQNRRLADALADISHQIKTPLTALNVATDLLRRQLATAPDSEEELKRLQLIMQLHAHIDDLVATLLKLARFDAGVIELEQTTVDGANLVNRLIDEHEISFEIAGIELESKVEGRPTFTGDADWTLEALSNIVKNCREHTPEYGHVTIQAYEDALACRFILSDSGSGIPPNDLPHIFERFYRGGDQTGNSDVNPQGNGIGLSLSMALIRAQGGTIAAHNRTGSDGSIIGSEFTVSLYKNTI